MPFSLFTEGSWLKVMGTMVGQTGEDFNKNNRHGNPMTLEQVVNMDKARHALSRKLNKSERFQSLCGDDDWHLAGPASRHIGNGYPPNPDVIYNHLTENRDHSSEAGKLKNSSKEHFTDTVKNNNYIMEHGLNDSNSKHSAASSPRLVTLKRSSNGEFDLALRDIAVVQEGIACASTTQEQIVTVVESGSLTSPSVFLPGDRLLEVNGLRVDGMAIGNIMSHINKSGDKVQLKVQPVPELNELFARTDFYGERVPGQDQYIQKGTLKRTGSMRFRVNKVNPSINRLQ